MSVLVIHVGLRQSGGSGSQGVGGVSGYGESVGVVTKQTQEHNLVRGIPSDIRGTQET